MLNKLGVVSILLLLRLIRSCFNGSCDDCDFKIHFETYDPFRTHHVWDDFYYGSKNKTPVFPHYEDTEIKSFECTLVAYDTKDEKGNWRKTISRSFGASNLTDCENKKLDRKKYVCQLGIS